MSSPNSQSGFCRDCVDQLSHHKTLRLQKKKKQWHRHTQILGVCVPDTGLACPHSVTPWFPLLSPHLIQLCCNTGDDHWTLIQSWNIHYQSWRVTAQNWKEPNVRGGGGGVDHVEGHLCLKQPRTCHMHVDMSPPLNCTFVQARLCFYTF